MEDRIAVLPLEESTWTVTRKRLDEGGKGTWLKANEDADMGLRCPYT